MGKILNTRNDGQDIVLELKVNPEEATILKGHYEDIHVFTERVAEFKTNISSRGKNSVTKYFLIPKALRKNLDYDCPINCQKIETKDRIMFIYVVDKNHPNCKEEE